MKYLILILMLLSLKAHGKALLSWPPSETKTEMVNGVMTESGPPKGYRIVYEAQGFPDFIEKAGA